MSLIGNPLISTNFQTDTFSGNGSTVSFTLSTAPASPASIAVYISGLYQVPGSAYTVSSTTLTFTGAPPTGTGNILVLHLGIQSQTLVPVNGSITPPMLNNANVVYWSTSNNNVGIGTSEPYSKATIYGTGNQFVSVASPTGSSTQVGVNLNPSMLPSEAAGNPAQASIYAVDSNYSANIIIANKTPGALGNSLTERVRINANGHVGISNNTPYNSAWTANSTQLSVGGYNNAYGVINMNGGQSTNTSYSIGVGGGILHLAYDNIAAQHRMSVSANGAVTMPFQPTFVGAHNNQYATTFTSNNVIPVNIVHYNVGSCYNSSTYRFTCPVAGFYEVKIQDIAQSDTGASVGFTVNGSLAFKFYNERRDKQFSAIWYCSANDYIEFRVTEGTTTLYGSSGYSHYSIRLLG